jgi:hypothetical protein
MSRSKETPLQVLQRKKVHLQAKANALSSAIDADVKYLQNNIVSLVTDYAFESLVSRMPPFLQNLIGKNRKEKKDKCDSTALIAGLAGNITDLIPFFVKGRKGLFISFIMKQIVKQFTA